MKTVKIECDSCGKDITSGGPMPNYRFVLCNEHVPNISGFEYTIYVEPLLKEAKYFCSMECLKDFIGRF